MRAGRVEEARALAVRIGKDITRHTKSQLNKIDGKTNSKDMWTAVRQLTGRQQEPAAIDGINAQSLNDHYAAISTDDRYTPPLSKDPDNSIESKYISEWQVFQILDHLRPTATGLDGLPAWFLRLGAPVFSKPVAYLFNLSMATSTVPQQCMEASENHA